MKVVETVKSLIGDFRTLALDLLTIAERSGERVEAKLGAHRFAAFLAAGFEVAKGFPGAIAFSKIPDLGSWGLPVIMLGYLTAGFLSNAVINVYGVLSDWDREHPSLPKLRERYRQKKMAYFDWSK